MRIRMLLAASVLAAAVVSLPAGAAEPTEIRVGHLHAGSGAFASISMPVYMGLKLWVDRTNAAGGVIVGALGNKRLPLRLIDYDDQSSTATAATLYNQLIAQDKVDLLIADSGSVLTSVAVSIAREHGMFLFDPTGTGSAFFKDNPMIALIADPVSTIWPKYIVDFLAADGVKAGIRKVAILYAINDFTSTQAAAVRDFIKQANVKGAGLEIVYDQGVPTSTSSYTTLITNIAATAPDALLAFGFPGNDIAFLRNLQDSGQNFRMVFTIYAGLETEELTRNVGASGLDGVFTYVTSAAIAYQPDVGLSLPELRTAWKLTFPDDAVHFGFNSVAGYTTGLVLERTLATAPTLDQKAIRDTVFGLSGKLKTLDGTFELDANGAQIGELTPLGQATAAGDTLTLRVVYPPDLADGPARFGKP